MRASLGEPARKTHAKPQSRLPPSSHIALLWRTSRPISFSYVGHGRKDYEVERSKVEPERLLSFLQDWFTPEMDLVHQPLVTIF
jgi:hypothetical protein